MRRRSIGISKRRSRACSGPKRSNGISPSFSSIAKATSSRVTHRKRPQSRSRPRSKKCCERRRAAPRRELHPRWGQRSGASRKRGGPMIARTVAILGVALCGALVPLAAPAQPDGGKVLRVAFPIAETGFDPQSGGDAYSNYVNRQVFDPLYKYEYLTRPYKLVPNTAAALPDISADGKTWTIKIRPGIYFADDPAFKGKRRELTAADYVYCLKRLHDPPMRSYFLQIVEGRFVGAEAVVAKEKATGTFDYDTPMEGLQAIDRYTLRFKLNFPDYELLANLTTTPTAAVAREVVETYRDASGWVMANPVGTGPYRLKDWRRAQRIVLEASPSFRDERYPEPTSAQDRTLAKTLAGRKLPLVGRIEISIIEEANPRLLAFMQKQLEFLAVPIDVVSNVMTPDGKLKPELAKQA